MITYENLLRRFRWRIDNEFLSCGVVFSRRFNGTGIAGDIKDKLDN